MRLYLGIDSNAGSVTLSHVSEQVLPVRPSLEEFQELSQKGNIIPICVQLAADYETPVSAYNKISNDACGSKNAFLFESAESSNVSGRYSILGSDPKAIFIAHGKNIHYDYEGEVKTWVAEKDVLSELEKIMQEYKCVEHSYCVPPFLGGMVGHLSYDAVSQFEPSITPNDRDDLGLPDATFFLADTVLIFDHQLKRLNLIANAFVSEHSQPKDAYQAAIEKLNQLMEKLEKPLHVPALNGMVEYKTPEFLGNTTQEEYEGMVKKAQGYIASGDAFQVVPSQRFETQYDGSSINLYRALRHVNPSPYMFILQLDGFSLVGSSPEVHVRSIDGKIDIRPIAGTRWRGKSEEEDDALAEDLLSDHKERAEHLMLVDLARNDVGRIAKHGSVSVDDFMIVEKYSHVMHIVSNVSGKLAEGFSAYDVLRSTFPAGTVSGAPKIRAMQIINELEKNKRCTYSGAVGYFGWDGGHDSCITLRTCLLKDGKAYIQAGAGVVADSDPISEHNECCNKAMGMMRAIGLAKTLK